MECPIVRMATACNNAANCPLEDEIRSSAEMAANALSLAKTVSDAADKMNLSIASLTEAMTAARIETAKLCATLEQKEKDEASRSELYRWVVNTIIAVVGLLAGTMIGKLLK